MSMIRCEGCDATLDAKNEGIEGVYSDKAPFNYYCPECVGNASYTDSPADLLDAIKAAGDDRWDEIKSNACTCGTPHVHATMESPPEPKSIRSVDCPVHGWDADLEHDARIDDQLAGAA